MKLPEPNIFFFMLADDAQYNKFKDIFKRNRAEDKHKTLNITSTRDEIFSKFENAQNVNDFEEILEDEFENQYDTLVMMYGEGGSNPKYGDFDKFLAVMWTRLKKLMQEGGRKKPKTDTTQKIINSFITNYQDKKVQDDFFGLIVGIMEKTTAEDRSRQISMVRKEFSNEQKVKIIEILTSNFSSQTKPSVEQFYEDDIAYFDYFSLEYYLKNTIKQPRKYQGWERVSEEEKLAGDIENSEVYAKIFKVGDATLESKKRLIDYVSGEDTDIVGEVANYSLLYEVFKSRDEDLKREKIETLKIQEKTYRVKEMTDDVKIKKYFELMGHRKTIGKTLDMAIIVNNNKTLKGSTGGGFFKKDGKFVDVHPILENLLFEGLDKALQKVKRSNLVDNDVIINYLSRKYDYETEDRAKERLPDEAPTKIDLETQQKKLQNRLLDNRGINYHESLLIDLFKEARDNERIQKNKPKLAKYGEYLKGDMIDVSKTDSIFSNDSTKMFEKLVRAGKQDGEEIFITFNSALQAQLARDLPSIARIIGDKKINLNQYTQTVYFEKEEKAQGEVPLTKETNEQKTFRALEEQIENTFTTKVERSIFDYVRESSGDDTFRENTDDFQNYSIVDATEGIAFAVWLAKNYLDKDYTDVVKKIEDEREDLSPNNDSLVKKIKDFATTLENDLKELKRPVVVGIDEKLDQVANKKGKFGKILKGKDGRKLQSYLVRNEFLEEA